MENLYPALFGLIGTGLMGLVLYVISQAGTGKSTLVKGIGSAIPTGASGSLVPGIVVFIASGILFAYLFPWLGWEWAYLVPGQLLLLGVAIGLARGIAQSIVLGLLAFDQGPLEAMGAVGFGVGLAHIIGHALYGLTIALLYGLTRVEYALAF